jgi:hypothetical protein
MSKPRFFTRGATSLVGLAIVLSACVTVNIYFPAAAAEQAAEQIVEDVLGKRGMQEPPPPSGETEGSIPAAQRSLLAVIDWLIPPARAAAPDFDVDTPAIRQIQARMRARNNQLRPFYASGAAGFGNDGLIKIRDSSAVGLRDRTKFTKLVEAENSDRRALYLEIAKANGHPEWEGKVKAVFARKWVEKASKGWWVQDASGGWRKK